MQLDRRGAVGGNPDDAVAAVFQDAEVQGGDVRRDDDAGVVRINPGRGLDADGRGDGRPAGAGGDRQKSRGDQERAARPSGHERRPSYSRHDGRPGCGLAGRFRRAGSRPARLALMELGLFETALGLEYLRQRHVRFGETGIEPQRILVLRDRVRGQAENPELVGHGQIVARVVHGRLGRDKLGVIHECVRKTGKKRSLRGRFALVQLHLLRKSVEPSRRALIAMEAGRRRRMAAHLLQREKPFLHARRDVIVARILQAADVLGQHGQRLPIEQTPCRRMMRTPCGCAGGWRRYDLPDDRHDRERFRLSDGMVSCSIGGNHFPRDRRRKLKEYRLQLHPRRQEELLALETASSLRGTGGSSGTNSKVGARCRSGVQYPDDPAAQARVLDPPFQTRLCLRQVFCAASRVTRRCIWPSADSFRVSA